MIGSYDGRSPMDRVRERLDRGVCPHGWDVAPGEGCPTGGGCNTTPAVVVHEDYCGYPDCDCVKVQAVDR